MGSHLVKALKKMNHEVISFRGDISKKVNLKISPKIDVVIHLASVINKRNKNIYNEVNIRGTKNIIEFCKENNAGRFIFLSSIKVLSSLNDPYAVSKREAEKIVTGSGLPYIILRPSMIYGPGDKKNLGFLLKIAKFTPLMPLLNFRLQPIFVDDIIKIIVACFNLHPGQVFNIVGPETISFENLLKTIKSLRYKFFIISMPSFFSFIIKLFSFLPFSPLTPWQVKSLFSDEIFDGCAWSEIFSVKPTLFSQGLSKTIYTNYV
ncbi:MAG: NAD-dependent epimerase/dehydratase [Parcubacteria group bacterium Athens0714_24]|nr:MAG: NAD-dependent epimerase/dehydratase [Parcubacteria group bacterium Athens0714_24]